MFASMCIIQRTTELGQYTDTFVSEKLSLSSSNDSKSQQQSFCSVGNCITLPWTCTSCRGVNTICPHLFLFFSATNQLISKFATK